MLNFWANYAQTIGKLHYMVAGRVGYDNMYRVGNMRNGMFADNSAGKSKDANFLTGGVKSNATVTLWWWQCALSRFGL